LECKAPVKFAADTSSTVVFVTEKPVSDAQKMSSASEKCVLVPQTVVSTMKTIALIIETTVSTTGKMVSLRENVFWLLKTAVEAFQTRVGMSPTGGCVFSTGTGVSETLVWETKPVGANPATIFWLTSGLPRC
jgi:hypothetical protein